MSIISKGSRSLSEAISSAVGITIRDSSVTSKVSTVEFRACIAFISASEKNMAGTNLSALVSIIVTTNKSEASGDGPLQKI